MIDIVIPLGTGSHWQDNELRYCLRSIEKHLTNFNNIYIVGRLPEFITNTIHIPHDDIEKCKETNIYRKVVKACQNTNITDQFLFFNDDHFLMHDFDAKLFPNFCKGDLVTLIQKLPQYNTYRKSVMRTASTLKQLGLSTNNFDTHTPIIYNKYSFLDVMCKYDWTNPYGFVVKSLYANTLNIEPIREPDCKINFVPLNRDQLWDHIKERKVWSIGNNAINNVLLGVLNQLYPNASRWEK